MEQITERTTGTFDVVNRQTGHVVGEVRINGGEFVSFTPAQLPAQPESVPEPDEYGYWTRRPDGGLHYHAYDPATEDGEGYELQQAVDILLAHPTTREENDNAGAV